MDTGNFISVSLKQSVARLKNICGIEMSFCNCLELYKLRNKLQHFTLTQEPLSAVLIILTKSIIEITNFIELHVFIHINDDSVIDVFKEHLKELNYYGENL